MLGPQSEQGLETGHRVAPPVPAEDELVEVDRELVRAHAAVRTEEPGLRVRDDAKCVRQNILGSGEAEALLGARQVDVAVGSESTG